MQKHQHTIDMFAIFFDISFYLAAEVASTSVIFES
jgi:hypothetical protein